MSNPTMEEVWYDFIEYVKDLHPDLNEDQLEDLIDEMDLRIGEE